MEMATETVFHSVDSSSDDGRSADGEARARAEEEGEAAGDEARNNYKLVNVASMSGSEDEDAEGAQGAEGGGQMPVANGEDAAAPAAAAAAPVASRKRDREEFEAEHANDNNGEEEVHFLGEKIAEVNVGYNDGHDDEDDEDDEDAAKDAAKDEGEEFGAADAKSRRQSGGAYRYFAAPKCRRCGEEGHISAECLQAPAALSCLLCGEMGHSQLDCPQIVCFKCGRSGHLSRDCTSSVAVVRNRDLSKPRLRIVYKDLRGTVCMHCFAVGHVNCRTTTYSKGLEGRSRARIPSGSCANCAGSHFDQSCPEPEFKESQGGSHLDSTTCYICHRTGHIAGMCPQARDGSRQRNKRRRSAPGHFGGESRRGGGGRQSGGGFGFGGGGGGGGGYRGGNNTFHRGRSPNFNSGSRRDAKRQRR